jgi:hypothetical protein
MPQRQLRDICGARAGDKGDISDVTLFADSGEGYELIRQAVTVDVVKAHFGPMVKGPIVRFEAPNVWGLKFVMPGALSGGGPLSLRSDNLGKTLSGALLRLRIEVPERLTAELPRLGRTAPIDPSSPTAH